MGGTWSWSLGEAYVIPGLLWNSKAMSWVGNLPSVSARCVQMVLRIPMLRWKFLSGSWSIWWYLFQCQNEWHGEARTLHLYVQYQGCELGNRWEKWGWGKGRNGFAALEPITLKLKNTKLCTGPRSLPVSCGQLLASRARLCLVVAFVALWFHGVRGIPIGVPSSQQSKLTFNLASSPHWI
jgi:hypothetical protein